MEESRSKESKTCLGVVIPCFNERGTLRRCVERIISLEDSQLSFEIIIVDDCSTDGSNSIALGLAERYPGRVTVLRHQKNQGKGAALRTGFTKATGDFVCVQDADLEYDPSDLKRLLRPLLAGKADVVLGSRFLSSGEHRVLYFWHCLGNRFLTFLSNMFTDLNLTDMETGYKVFRRDVLQKITIQEDRFGFEPEIVAKIAHMRLRIYEIGISYYGRTYEEGKKIGVKDGLRAIYCIMRYNLHPSSPRGPIHGICFYRRRLSGFQPHRVSRRTFVGVFRCCCGADRVFSGGRPELSPVCPAAVPPWNKVVGAQRDSDLYARCMRYRGLRRRVHWIFGGGRIYSLDG
jgi:glycosyltransferase involved in cell wall biosynthesis